MDFEQNKNNNCSKNKDLGNYKASAQKDLVGDWYRVEKN